MKKQHLIIVIVTALITLNLFLCVYLISFQRTDANPTGTVGNTAGNLNNAGTFCEYKGLVYFSNAFDGGALYIMNSDESNLTKINDLKVRNLLAGGEYLYFYQEGSSSDTEFAGLEAVLPGKSSFIRCRLDGRQSIALTRDYLYSAQLVDNYLYILGNGESGYAFYKTDIYGNDKTILADYEINPSCACDGKIYYNGTGNNHYLYSMDVQTDVAKEIWAGNLWYPAVEGDYVYFLDVSNDYRLCRYSMSQGVVEILTHDRVDCFNVGSGYIYYQKNSYSTPQLICMRVDGSDRQVVAEGNYTHINMTSHFVYFQDFTDRSLLYHCPIGSTSYEIFSAARKATTK